MKALSLIHPSSARIAAVFALLSGVTLFAEDPLYKLPPETQRDMGSGYEKKHETALRLLSEPGSNVQALGFDIDTDVNRDGVIDYADQRWHEYTPPGCVLKVGETTPIKMRIFSHIPYYPGSAVARLEVCGINRENPRGEFASLDEEIHNTGHVIIWTDAQKSHKLLDSADPKMRVVEWIIRPGYILPEHTGVPNTVYLEAVGHSGKYAGDVRVMSTIAPLPAAKGETSYHFMVSENHILFTVLAK